MSKMHIKEADIANQTPGYSQKAYLALLSEIDTIPAATAGVISGDITFLAATPTNGFLQVHNLSKRQASAMATTGEAGGLSPNYTHTFAIPGDKMTIQEAINTYLNKGLIVLVQDGTEGGAIKMFGTEQNPAYIDSASFESGTLADGTKATIINVWSKNKYDYTGTITEYNS